MGSDRPLSVSLWLVQIPADELRVPFDPVQAKEEGIGLGEVLDRVTMQVSVGDDRTMIAAPVQCDVDRIPKGSHYLRVPPMGQTSNARESVATDPSVSFIAQLGGATGSMCAPFVGALTGPG
jgi:hypothetical protein